MGLKTADLLIPVNQAKQSKLAKYTGLLAQAPSFMMWLTRHKTEHTDKVCMDFLRKLRHATPRSLKIGMVGFCWGGRYAFRAGLESNMIQIDGEKVPLIDAAVGLHPSNLTLANDVETLVVPVSFGWGLEDAEVKIELKDKVEAIHENARRAGRTVPEMEHRVYKPGRHGFAVRGNPDDPEERACLEDSEKQALDWLRRWL